MKVNNICTNAISFIRDTAKEVSYRDFLQLCKDIAHSQYTYLDIKDLKTLEEINKYLFEVSRSNKISFDGYNIKVNY